MHVHMHVAACYCCAYSLAVKHHAPMDVNCDHVYPSGNSTAAVTPGAINTPSLDPHDVMFALPSCRRTAYCAVSAVRFPLYATRCVSGAFPSNVRPAICAADVDVSVRLPPKCSLVAEAMNGERETSARTVVMQQRRERRESLVVMVVDVDD